MVVELAAAELAVAVLLLLLLLLLLFPRTISCVCWDVTGDLRRAHWDKLGCIVTGGIRVCERVCLGCVDGADSEIS